MTVWRETGHPYASVGNWRGKADRMKKRMTADQRIENREAQKDLAIIIGGVKHLRLTLDGMTFPPFNGMGDDLRAATDGLLAKFEAAHKRLKG